MFCCNCGKEIDDKAVVCVGCGVAVKTVDNKQASQRFSNLQIIAFVLFGLQILALIGAGINPFYMLGFMSLSVAGVILLIMDAKRNTTQAAESTKSIQDETLDDNDKTLSETDKKMLPENQEISVVAISFVFSILAFVLGIVSLATLDIWAEVLCWVFGVLALISSLISLYVYTHIYPLAKSKNYNHLAIVISVVVLFFALIVSVT